MKILSVDDHRLFAEGLRNLLDDFVDPPDFEVCYSCEEAFELTHLDQVDLILLDYYLSPSGIYGMEALAEFRPRCPSAPVVVLSGVSCADEIRKMIDNGAAGFIPKSSTFDVLKAALNLVLAGGIYLPPEALDEVEAPLAISVGAGLEVEPTIQSKVRKLTRRQRAVLRSMVQGKPNKQIAIDLKISVHTVKAHASKVFQVLDVSSRTEAVYVVAKLGLDWLLMMDEDNDPPETDP